MKKKNNEKTLSMRLQSLRHTAKLQIYAKNDELKLLDFYFNHFRLVHSELNCVLFWPLYMCICSVKNSELWLCFICFDF